MKSASLFPRYPREHLERLIRLESKDLFAVLAFALGAGVMALATPMAVQALVNSIAFGVLVQPLVVLILVLFGCLALNSVLNGLQIFVVEMIQRRLFVRLVSQISTTLLEGRLDHPLFKKGSDLANYYFEVMTIQKTWSNLLLDGLSYGLQTLIGLILLAFYHPALLGFDALIIASLYVIFRVLGKEGIETAVTESEAKHAVASWLQELPRHPLATRYGHGKSWGLDRSNALTERYLERSKDHFKVLMKQQAAILGLYAVANSVLLGLGGWMVIERQLTLGQLVAAELIVSAMLSGLTRLGKTITSYYDLMAGMEKLTYLLDLPDEPQRNADPHHQDVLITIKFDQIVINIDENESEKPLAIPDLEIRAGEKCLFVCPDPGASVCLLQSISGHRQSIEGAISINGIDTRILGMAEFREQSFLVTKPEWFQVSIIENIKMGNPSIGLGQVQEVLRVVGLDQTIQGLSGGARSNLTVTGAPLDYEQLGRLTLARAIAAQPRFLMVGPLIDSVAEPYLQDILDTLLGQDAPWSLVLVTANTRVFEAVHGRAKVIRLEPKQHREV
ncbi:MAG: ABC transporter ATP-binding protein [Gammaproteobacteria bacterium]|nr:ABC transporter ATP-binding protein [Gammaproteobacteria bacterium]NBT45400.1 ABC transporter ATP-binding protein [Gammaproteobacteria bacterium]NBY21322.1 ABC transporter ATP-binding protein [Gammaproteobacteria bacterium]NDE35319.1 ABC transporter ATP-binding protein [Gammaproteobacteria bacterium]NDG88560.1 ABC transporter ATP-binding protein [Gammaproteobacteria bacterium]